MRKKEPEAVRRALLDSAASIAAAEGFAAVTIQSVATAANVTKGGLFHHFPSKQALVEGMCLDQLAKLDAEIDAVIANDPLGYGRFTRAYITTILDRKLFGSKTAGGALSVAITADQGMYGLWSKWLHSRLEQHRDTDGATALTIPRLAADGAWFLYIVPDSQNVDVDEIRQLLLVMTTEKSDDP